MMDADRPTGLLRWLGILALLILGGWAGYWIGDAGSGVVHSRDDYDRMLHLLELQLASRPPPTSSGAGATMLLCVFLLIIVVLVVWRADRSDVSEGEVLHVLLRADVSPHVVRSLSLRRAGEALPALPGSAADPPESPPPPIVESQRSAAGDEWRAPGGIQN